MVSETPIIKANPPPVFLLVNHLPTFIGELVKS